MRKTTNMGYMEKKYETFRQNQVTKYSLG